MIYVISPGGYKTGGTELAHQLVYKLNNMGIESLIAYSSNRDNVYLHPAFKKYIDRYIKIEEIIDASENIVIIPETLTELIPSFSNSTVYIWWMSVNNYYNRRNRTLEVEEYGMARYIVSKVLGILRVKKFKTRKYLPFEKMKNVKLHLVQSQYAKDFLNKNGISNIAFLSDYINKSYIEESGKVQIDCKSNLVIYNPKKGKRYTKKIIKRNKDINFIPLQNMSNIEVTDTMKKAKVYIDFGSHPGKDRMPREAAMMMCCIITGRRGAAAYYEDIPIDDIYKIDEKRMNCKEIGNLIRNMFENYSSVLNDFKSYRKWISEEEERFEDEIKQVFL